MKTGYFLTLVLITVGVHLSAASVISDKDAQIRQASDYRKAVYLYENRNYQAARNLFELQPKGAVSDAYICLCALKMRSSDSDQVLEAYRTAHPASRLTNDVLFEHASNLFDDMDYEATRQELQNIYPEKLSESQAQSYWFMKGYSEYSLDSYPEAIAAFTKLESLPLCDQSAVAHFLHGLILYNLRDFAQAVPHFRESWGDSRFAELSEFYVLDCEFNLKNYDYVISRGEALYASSPKERQEHLARLISEAYLIKGDKEKAREYFDGSYHTDLSRSDFFYSGEVLYAVDDFRGAIEQFNNMPDRSDSLGQIANYHLANSYLRTRNKVAAMGAFKDAASVDFDQRITEDAMFNYAKLAFDLNKDTNIFAEYIKRYSTKTRGEQIYTYMALAGLTDRDYAGAIAAYDNIDELSDEMLANYTKANFLRAEQLMNNASYSDAIPYLRTAAYYLPRNNRFGQLSRYYLAESYYRTGDYKDAERTFLELYNSDALYGLPEGALLPYNLAYCYLKQKNYDSAAKWFDIYSNSSDSPFRKDARYRRADCDYLMGDYKSAIKSYKSVLEEYPPVDDLYALYQMAMSEGLSKKPKDKVKTLSRAEKADSSAYMYPECLYELGNTRYELKYYSDAVQTFDMLCKSSPNDIWTAKGLLGRAKVLKRMGNNVDALETYKSLVSLLPGSEYADQAVKAIEEIYKSIKAPEKFQEYLAENSIEDMADPNYREKMSFRTAEQLFKSADYRNCVESLQKYISDYPTGASLMQAKYYLGESYNQLGDKEKAAQYFQQIAESGVESALTLSARASYAQICYALERFSGAYKAYSALYSTTNDNKTKQEALLGMMRSAFRAKDYSETIQAAQTLRKISGLSSELKREADFVLAKSLFSTSQREQALALFTNLASNSSTSEGAEAKYMLMVDAFDRGEFESVEKMITEFSQNFGEQSYWLAKAFILLGDSFVERGDYKRASQTYESIRDGYVAQSGADDIEDILNMKLAKLSEIE